MAMCANRKIAKLRCPLPLPSVSNYVRWHGDASGENSGDMLILAMCVDPVMQLTDTSARNCGEEMSNSKQWVLQLGGLNNNID
jgi:hypothetical protein